MLIYLDKILIQPYKKRGQKETLTRFSEKINSAIWYPEDNEHVIFVVGDTVKIIELDDRGKRNIHDLTKMQNFAENSWEKPQIIYDFKKNKLYFINDNNLYYLQIKTGQLWQQAATPILQISRGDRNYKKIAREFNLRLFAKLV